MARRERREPAISNQGEARTGWTQREAPYGDGDCRAENKGGANHSAKAKWAASIYVSVTVCLSGCCTVFWSHFRVLLIKGFTQIRIFYKPIGTSSDIVCVELAFAGIIFPPLSWNLSSIVCLHALFLPPYPMLPGCHSFHPLPVAGA